MKGPAIIDAPELERRVSAVASPRTPAMCRRAYIINQFPSFIETMIYREVGALRALGENIATFSIRRPRLSDVPHEALRFVDDTYYILPIGTVRFIRAHLAALVRYPVRYWSTLFEVLTATHSSHRDRLRTLAHFAEAVTLLDEMTRRQIDHIHAHWAVGSATCAMVVSRFLGIPFSFTAHAYDVWRDKLLLPEKVHAASFVVTCTDYNRRHLVETYGVSPEKVRVVYHGVDVARFVPEPPARNGGEPTLLAVGRLVEQKGFDRFVSACAKLVSDGYRFRCQIVGDGPLRQALEEQTRRLGLDSRITFAGRKLQEELVAYYASADVFVMPCIPASDNDRDGIPNTLIEAMAMEVPVVSTRFSGIPELVADGVNGRLVEPGDVDGLAEALAQMIGHPDERRRMGKAGRHRVLDRFTIERSAECIRDTFEAFGHAGRTDVDARA